MERQRQNMLPMLSLIFLSALGSAAGLLWLKPEIRWPLAVMGLLDGRASVQYGQITVNGKAPAPGRNRHL